MVEREKKGTAESGISIPTQTLPSGSARNHKIREGGNRIQGGIFKGGRALSSNQRACHVTTKGGTVSTGKGRWEVLTIGLEVNEGTADRAEGREGHQQMGHRIRKGLKKKRFRGYASEPIVLVVAAKNLNESGDGGTPKSGPEIQKTTNRDGKPIQTRCGLPNADAAVRCRRKGGQAVARRGG